MKNERLTLDKFKGISLDQILTIKELQGVKGGFSGSQQTTYSYDCVLNCFDYLDGDSHDYNFYKYSINYGLGYDPYLQGGVLTEDISTIGSYGGFAITELTGGSFSLNSNGTSNGNRIIMTFDGGGGADHAVIVTGYEDDNGSIFIKYFDPTTGDSGKRTPSSSSFYSVM